MRTTVRPTVLLPDTDDVLRVGRIDGNRGLDFSVEVIGTRLASVRTTGVGTWAGDECERGTSVCKGTTESGHDGQDNQQCHPGDKYKLNMLDVMHLIPLWSTLTQIERK